jgi:hypothetical protein
MFCHRKRTEHVACPWGDMRGGAGIILMSPTDMYTTPIHIQYAGVERICKTQEELIPQFF